MKINILPASFWIVYSLTDVKYVQNMLPKDLIVSPVSPVKGLTPEKCLLMNAYSLKSKFMSGNRLDIQTYAINRITGEPHLVVLDVLTDTLDWNPLNGLRLSNANVKVWQSSMLGMQFRRNSGMRTGVTFKGIKGNHQNLHYDFAVTANKKTYYRDCDYQFRMTFNEDEIMKPVLQMDELVISNGIWNHCREKEPTCVFMHTQKMTFDVDMSDHFPQASGPWLRW